MANKKTGASVTKYAPEKQSGKKTAVAKIVLPQLPLDECFQKLTELRDKALADNPDITRARGSVTLY